MTTVCDNWQIYKGGEHALIYRNYTRRCCDTIPPGKRTIRDTTWTSGPTNGLSAGCRNKMFNAPAETVSS